MISTKFRKLVKIHAWDLTAYTDWADIHKAIKEEMSVPCFTGYIIYKDQQQTIITSDYDIDKDGSITVGNRTIIPTKVIKKIEVLYDGTK
tara:strand:- start:358 stop:627 length:270 start_codon:yes stop_codon:yes gene_type:complete